MLVLKFQNEERREHMMPAEKSAGNEWYQPKRKSVWDPDGAAVMMEFLKSLGFTSCHHKFLTLRY